MTTSRRFLWLALVASPFACTAEAPPAATPPADAGQSDAVATLDVASAPDGATADDVVVPDAPIATDVVADRGTACVDMDGDGYPSTECGGMPADCNDGSPAVNPGRSEVCDAMGTDEDCNPCTVAGATDGDGDRDTFLSAGCFNRYAGATPTCDPARVRVDGAMLRVAGRDCDDTNNNVRPDQTESACNSIDDNCDGRVDEGPQRTFYRDADGDGFGDSTAPTRMACTPPAGYVENNTDCDDDPMTGVGVNPSGREACDDAMRDENCNGARNEGCTCVEGREYPCAEQRGRCMGSVQRCGGNRLGMCSYTPQPEVCDGIDNDCDGMTDEPSSPTDTNGIVPRSCSVVTAQTPQPGLRREAFANPRFDGPPASTAVDAQIDVYWGGNGPPGVPNDNFSVRWTAMLQPPVDGLYIFDVSNCDDGARLWLDGGLVVDQPNFGGTRRGAPVMLLASRRYALRFEMREDGGGASAVLAWQRPGATAFETVPASVFVQPFVGVHGACRDGMTACQGGMEVCAGAQGPQTETCDNVDNDCDGMVDENDLRPWCRDADRDGHASMVASACVSGCRAPGERFLTEPIDDCNDNELSVHPLAAEVCDGLDNDCDGPVDETATTLTCGVGECRRSTSSCVGGRPTSCVPGTAVTEVCNNRDDNCDGIVDQNTRGCGNNNDFCPGTDTCSNGVWSCNAPRRCPILYYLDGNRSCSWDHRDPGVSRTWRQGTQANYQEISSAGFAVPELLGLTPDPSCYEVDVNVRFTQSSYCPVTYGEINNEIMCDEGDAAFQPIRSSVFASGGDIWLSGCRPGGRVRIRKTIDGEFFPGPCNRTATVIFFSYRIRPGCQCRWRY